MSEILKNTVIAKSKTQLIGEGRRRLPRAANTLAQPLRPTGGQLPTAWYPMERV